MSSLEELKDQIGEIGVRRTHEMRQTEFDGKLSSKRDWYQFLQQHL